MNHKMVIKHSDDECFTILLDGEEVGYFNHDRHGWDGMEAAEKLARSIAGKLGIEVEETYGDDEEA